MENLESSTIKSIVNGAQRWVAEWGKHCLRVGTYPSWAGSREFVKRLGQMDFWIPDSVSDGIVLLFPCKRQLRESRLVARRLFDVNEVLVVRDAVVFRQFKQADEGLEQRGPEHKD